MPSAVKKLNNLPKRSDRWWRLPCSALKQRLPKFDEKGNLIVTSEGEVMMRKSSFADLKLIGETFSFSNIKDEPDAVCERSYTDFEKRLRCARSTVGKSIKACREAKVITQTKHFHKKSEYKCDAFASDEFYITIEEYLTTLQFNIPREGSARKLTASEVLTLSYLATHSNIPSAAGACDFTMQELCDDLGICDKTLRESLYVLISAGFLSCRQRIHGCRSDKRLHINVNSDVRKLMKHESRRAQASRRLAEQEQARKISEADQKAEREHYYAVLRQEAEALSDKYKAYVERDGEFCEIRKELVKIDIEAAAAEVQGLREALADAERRRTELQARRARVLARLRIKEENLHPQYKCKKCSDTGYLPGGRQCDCYSPPGGSS